MTRTQQGLFPSKTLSRKLKREAEPELDWLPITPGSVLLCIDPSIAACGWAIVRNTVPNPERIDSGILKPVGLPERNRCDHLCELLKQRIELAEERPTDAIIETPGGGQRPGTSATQLMRYARAIGVCEATCFLLGLSVNRVQVPEWKGMNKKSRTALIVTHCFNYQPRDDNEADALGLGLWLCSKTRRSAT